LIVVLDASVLIFLFEKDANAPLDPETGAPVDRCYDRVNHLVATLDRAKATIIVPTPALGEILVKAGDAGPSWLQILEKVARIRVASFDTMAAVEFAALQRERSERGAKTSGGRAKAKFDDQIIAIAPVAGAETIYSDDRGLAAAAGSRLDVIGVAGIPLPPVDPQLALNLDLSDRTTDTDGDAEGQSED
jgi:predicted nucleic acid-binding protein